MPEHSVHTVEFWLDIFVIWSTTLGFAAFSEELLPGHNNVQPNWALTGEMGKMVEMALWPAAICSSGTTLCPPKCVIRGLEHLRTTYFKFLFFFILLLSGFSASACDTMRVPSGAESGSAWSSDQLLQMVGPIFKHSSLHAAALQLCLGFGGFCKCWYLQTINRRCLVPTSMYSRPPIHLHCYGERVCICVCVCV